MLDVSMNHFDMRTRIMENATNNREDHVFPSARQAIASRPPSARITLEAREVQVEVPNLVADFALPSLLRDCRPWIGIHNKTLPHSIESAEAHPSLGNVVPEEISLSQDMTMLESARTVFGPVPNSNRNERYDAAKAARLHNARTIPHDTSLQEGLLSRTERSQESSPRPLVQCGDAAPSADLSSIQFGHCLRVNDDNGASEEWTLQSFSKSLAGIGPKEISKVEKTLDLSRDFFPTSDFSEAISLEEREELSTQPAIRNERLIDVVRIEKNVSEERPKHRETSSYRRCPELPSDKANLGPVGSEKRRLAEAMAKWNNEKHSLAMYQKVPPPSTFTSCKGSNAISPGTSLVAGIRLSHTSEAAIDIDVECAFSPVKASTCEGSEIDIEVESAFKVPQDRC